MTSPQTLSAATPTPAATSTVTAWDDSVPACIGEFVVPDPWRLEHGAAFERPCIAYELLGQADTPVVAVLGGISASRHVCASAFDPRPGWWQHLAGIGTALDPRHCRILSFDYLGGNGASTGPRTSRDGCTPGDFPAGSFPDGSFPDGSFPTVDTHDQARALAAVLDHLEIERLHAIVGSSYGGMVGLAFAERYGQRLEHLVTISGGDRSHPQSTGWRCVQRQAVRFGIEQGTAAAGLALARALAMVTYRSPEELAQRFDEPPRHTADGVVRFAVEDYLVARGDDFAASFHPQAFLCLSESIDLHRVDPAAVSTPTTVIAVTSDQLVPLATLERLADQLAGSSQLHVVESLYGHDAFLKETARLSEILRQFLPSCSASEGS